METIATILLIIIVLLVIGILFLFKQNLELKDQLLTEINHNKCLKDELNYYLMINKKNGLK